MCFMKALPRRNFVTSALFSYLSFGFKISQMSLWSDFLTQDNEIFMASLFFDCINIVLKIFQCSSATVW